MENEEGTLKSMLICIETWKQSRIARKGEIEQARLAQFHQILEQQKYDIRRNSPATTD